MLDHFCEVVDSMLCDGLVLGAVLDGQHLADDGFFEHLDGLEVKSNLLKPAALHTLIFSQ